MFSEQHCFQLLLIHLKAKNVLLLRNCRVKRFIFSLTRGHESFFKHVKLVKSIFVRYIIHHWPFFFCTIRFLARCNWREVSPIIFKLRIMFPPGYNRHAIIFAMLRVQRAIGTQDIKDFPSPVNRHFWPISQLTRYRREEYQTNRQAAHLHWWICCLAQHQLGSISYRWSVNLLAFSFFYQPELASGRKEGRIPFQPFSCFFRLLFVLSLYWFRTCR